ncbi:MAG: RidA family protein, partial [Planctomycetota bacterium]|nr:RidA family protein [Planctomycetota bacterium]
GDFGTQFEKALGNVIAVIQAAGGEASNIVSMTVYVTDKDAYEADLASIGQTWRAIVGRHYPAMALVEVAALLEKGAMVEIEARAALAE